MRTNKKVYMSVIRSNTMKNESKGKILALKEEYEREIEYRYSLKGKCSKEIYDIEMEIAIRLKQVVKDLEELLK